jgi:hypothetical protein
LEKNIHDNAREIEKIEMLLKYIDFDAVLKKDIDNYKTNQAPYFERRNKTALATWSQLRAKEKKDDFYHTPK